MTTWRPVNTLLFGLFVVFALGGVTAVALSVHGGTPVPLVHDCPPLFGGSPSPTSFYAHLVPCSLGVFVFVGVPATIGVILLAHWGR